MTTETKPKTPTVPEHGSAEEEARAMLANPRLQKKLAELRAMTPPGEPLFGFPLKFKDARSEVPKAEQIEVEKGAAIVTDQDAAAAYVGSVEVGGGVSPRMPTGKIRVKSEVEGAAAQDSKRQQVTQRSIARGGTGPRPPALPFDPTEETAEPAVTSAFTKSTASTAPTVTTKRATVSVTNDVPALARTFGLSKTSWGIVLAMLSGAVIAVVVLRSPSKEPLGAAPNVALSSVAPRPSLSATAPEVSTATLTETLSATAIPSVPASLTPSAIASPTVNAAPSASPAASDSPKIKAPGALLTPPTSTPTVEPVVTAEPAPAPSVPASAATSATSSALPSSSHPTAAPSSTPSARPNGDGRWIRRE